MNWNKLLGLKQIDSWSRLMRMSVCFAYFMLLLLIGYVIIISVQLTTFRGLESAYQKDEAKLINLIKKSVQAKEFNDQIDMVEKRYREIMLSLPNQKRASGFIYDIYKLATKNDVSVNSITPGQRALGVISYELPIKISVTGSYDDVGKFLSSIANYNHVVSFEDLDFKKATKNKREVINLSFTLITYYVDRKKLKTISDIIYKKDKK